MLRMMLIEKKTYHRLVLSLLGQGIFDAIFLTEKLITSLLLQEFITLNSFYSLPAG